MRNCLNICHTRMPSMQIHWALEILNFTIRFAATPGMQTWAIKEIIIILYLEICRRRAFKTPVLQFSWARVQINCFWLVVWVENCTKRKLRLKLIIWDLLPRWLAVNVPKKINWKCSTQRKLPISVQPFVFIFTFLTLHKHCFAFNLTAKQSQSIWIVIDQTGGPPSHFLYPPT